MAPFANTRGMPVSDRLFVLSQYFLPKQALTVLAGKAASAKGGTLSKIVVNLAGPVTTARSDVDVIVTEFGAAELKGQTLAERTRRLIAIAHPDFREELDRAAHTIRQRGF